MKQGVPISPDDIPAAKETVFPPFVYDCFNKCITQKYTNGRATVYLKDVTPLIKDACKENNIPFHTDFLNIEEVYRAQGWNVVYDGPAYCESYDAYFVFSKKS